MTVNKILVPVDFTDVTSSAIRTAMAIAQQASASVVLFHVSNGKVGEDTASKLDSLAAKFNPESKIEIDCRITEGNVFQEISHEAEEGSYDLLVIGSHGYKGLREKIFGADILKLLKNIRVPSLTIQVGYNWPVQGIKRILVPVGSHEYYLVQLNAVLAFCELFGPEVHLYAVQKPGMQWSAQLKNNIEAAESLFAKNGIPYKMVKETATSFSVGYGRQILDYAKRTEMDLITFIANASLEHYYIADPDKITMLTNEMLIPVLSVSNKI